MIMNEDDVEELLKALESIREEKYPSIPFEVVKGIVYTQFESQDNRVEGRRITKDLIERFLNDVVK